MPDSAIIPMISASISMTTPRSGSARTSTSGTAATPSMIPTARSRGLLSRRGTTARIVALTKMMESLAYSDGSIWNPPGSVIHDFAPLTGAVK